VVYVGTHDCDTALGWWRTLPRRIKRASALPGVEPHWELIEATLSSRAELAILQAQDVLGLGSESRMNSPGTTTGNWSWRLQPRQLTKKHAARLRGLTEEASRLR
jgi:4-alpha-glucanotransferase